MSNRGHNNQSSRAPDWVKTLAKAELHVHLEGTMAPALVRRLADRNDIRLPDDLFDVAGDLHWTDFLHFLKVFDTAASVIQTPEDYRDVTFDYLATVARCGGTYAEVTTSSDHAALAGMSYADMLDGVAQGIIDAKDEYGVDCRIIVSGVRHYGAEAVEAVARSAANHPHPLVTGFGMGGDEAGYPADLFARAFAIASEEAGLHCTVHAGEFGGPESIRSALTLPVTRIGHGVRAIEDPDLVAELADRGTVLEVCPTSNIRTRVYAGYADHPLPHLLAAGVRCTVSSDDPPYFDTDIGKEYEVAATELGLTRTDLERMTRTAMEAAFLTHPQ